jgi:hypothetical protein
LGVRFPLVGLAAVGLSAYFALHAFAVPNGSIREDFSAVAINLNGRATTTRVDIRIERWSTDQEREQLLDIVKEQPSTSALNRRLLRALQRMPRVGFIRTPGTLRWNLRYAQQQPLDEEGRQIVIATDRPIDFWEERDRPRVSDHPFTILELRLDNDSRGEGRMLGHTRILIDRRTNNLVLEDYALLPVRLSRVRPR